MVDFENALLNVLKNIFSNSKVNSCKLYFSLCVSRKIQENRLNTNYKLKKIYSTIRNCLNLLLPLPHAILKSYKTIKDQYQMDNKIDSLNFFFIYFEKKTFIGCIKDNPIVDLDIASILCFSKNSVLIKFQF